MTTACSALPDSVATKKPLPGFFHEALVSDTWTPDQVAFQRQLLAKYGDSMGNKLVETFTEHAPLGEEDIWNLSAPHHGSIFSKPIRAAELSESDVRDKAEAAWKSACLHPYGTECKTSAAHGTRCRMRAFPVVHQNIGDGDTDAPVPRTLVLLHQSNDAGKRSSCLQIPTDAPQDVIDRVAKFTEQTGIPYEITDDQDFDKPASAFHVGDPVALQVIPRYSTRLVGSGATPAIQPSSVVSAVSGYRAPPSALVDHRQCTMSVRSWSALGVEDATNLPPDGYSLVHEHPDFGAHVSLDEISGQVRALVGPGMQAQARAHPGKLTVLAEGNQFDHVRQAYQRVEEIVAGVPRSAVKAPVLAVEPAAAGSTAKGQATSHAHAEVHTSTSAGPSGTHRSIGSTSSATTLPNTSSCNHSTVDHQKDECYGLYENFGVNSGAPAMGLFYHFGPSSDGSGTCEHILADPKLTPEALTSLQTHCAKKGIDVFTKGDDGEWTQSKNKDLADRVSQSPASFASASALDRSC